MSDNKYEIRSNDVQEIMRKLPHAFITRGNILIILVLFIVFYFLNKFPIYQKETIYFELKEVNVKKGRHDSISLAVSLNVPIPIIIRRYQNAKLFIDNRNIGKATGFDGEIDSVGHSPYGAPIIYFQCGKPKGLLEKGMIGHIVIVAEERRFLAMLLDRLKI